MGLCSARMHFADDISLLAELLSLLIPVLEAFAEEAAAIGLEVNLDKTKVQALGTQQPDTDTLDVHGHQVAVVDEFVYSHQCAIKSKNQT